MINATRAILSIILVLLNSVLGLRYNFGDGTYYVGSVDSQGRPTGNGQFYNSHGDLEYDGEFQDGLKHGQGVLFYSDGSTFQGQFLYDKADGPGVLLRPNGDQIVGDFKNGRPHGKIVIKVAGNGTKIEGQFRHGMAHGLVRAFDGQRVVFEGLFRMGKAQGPGPAFIPRELQFTGLTI